MGYTGIYQKNIATSRSLFFRYMGDELGYPNFNLPHQQRDILGDDMEYPILKLPHRVLQIFWDIQLKLGYSGYWKIVKSQILNLDKG